MHGWTPTGDVGADPGKRYYHERAVPHNKLYCVVFRQGCMRGSPSQLETIHRLEVTGTTIPNARWAREFPADRDPRGG